MSLEQWKSAPINTLFLLDGQPDAVLAWEDESALIAFQRKPRVVTLSIAARKLDALAELLEAAMEQPPFPAPWELRIGQPDVRSIRRLAEPLGWEATQHYVGVRRSDLERLPALRPGVRPARRDDLDALADLNRTARTNEFRTIPDVDEVRTWLAEDQVFVAEDGAGVAGFIVTWCYPREVRDHQFIAALAVEERARESELGRMLLVHALHWGRDTGARRALAWVEKGDLDNRRLYEALGFEAYGDEELHLRWHGRVRVPTPAERDPRPGDRRAGTTADFELAGTVVEQRPRRRPEDDRQRSGGAREERGGADQRRERDRTAPRERSSHRERRAESEEGREREQRPQRQGETRFRAIRTPRDEARGDRAPRDDARRDRAPRDEARGDRAPRDDARRDRPPRDETRRDRAPRDEETGGDRRLERGSGGNRPRSQQPRRQEHQERGRQGGRDEGRGRREPGGRGSRDEGSAGRGRPGGSRGGSSRPARSGGTRGRRDKDRE